MYIHISDDYALLCQHAADLIAAAVAAKPDAAVVLATGSTPIGVYTELAARFGRGVFDPSRLRVFQLDAYLGLAPDDRRSLFRWLDEAFLQPLQIAPAQVVRLPGISDDPAAACAAYDAAVQDAGGFDLALLGLGPNGHLGFNEPPSPPDAPTRVVTLSDASLDSNARYWGRRADVPRQALTCGMAQLLAARQTLLLVAGEHKRAILRRALSEPPTPDVPASLLHQAANVTVLADQAAWPDTMTGTRL